MYGYPPKNLKREPETDRAQELLGMNSQSLNNIDLPINSMVRNRGSNMNSYENKYSQRAKEGFEYWTKDKRYPENNKPKGIIFEKFLIKKKNFDFWKNRIKFEYYLKLIQSIKFNFWCVFF